MTPKMKTKEYLQQIQKIDLEIEHSIAELDTLKGLSTTISAMDYSKPRVQGGGSNEASFVRTIQKICDLEEKINRQIDSYVDLRHKIIREIQSIQNVVYSEMLYKRYVEYKDYDVIARELGCTKHWVKHLHSKAIAEFDTKKHQKTPKLPLKNNLDVL